MIKTENGKKYYYDKNGNEIHEGNKVLFPDGNIKRVYLTEREELGTDATNPLWIAKGRAVPCEYGIYPFEYMETNEIEIVKEDYN